MDHSKHSAEGPPRYNNFYAASLNCDTHVTKHLQKMARRVFLDITYQHSDQTELLIYFLLINQNPKPKGALHYFCKKKSKTK